MNDQSLLGRTFKQKLSKNFPQFTERIICKESHWESMATKKQYGI